MAEQCPFIHAGCWQDDEEVAELRETIDYLNGVVESRAEWINELRDENEGLIGKVGDCARCYDTQQGIEDILVDQIIDLRAENEKLQRILELHCERLWNFGDQRFIKEAEDRVTQEIEDEKQGDGPKDAVL